MERRRDKSNGNIERYLTGQQTDESRDFFLAAWKQLQKQTASNGWATLNQINMAARRGKQTVLSLKGHIKHVAQFSEK